MADDHVALGDVINALQAALNNDDLKTAYAKLDLFWARLAVHIRAEHLHLFPAIIQHGGDATLDQAVGRLRADHDFFMHELGRAIAIARGLFDNPDTATIKQGLTTIRELAVAVEKQLVVHNEIEENHIYRLTEILNEQDQAELAVKIDKELVNRPPRFSAKTWSNE